MRIAIETLGTRGDVQPYLALARGLLARGHDVQLAAPVQFGDVICGAERRSSSFSCSGENENARPNGGASDRRIGC